MNCGRCEIVVANEPIECMLWVAGSQKVNSDKIHSIGLRGTSTPRCRRNPKTFLLTSRYRIERIMCQNLLLRVNNRLIDG